MKLLIVCGPTATGKTKLSLHLAKVFGGELISADSRQVYKGYDALTGKERSEEIPIWLYDVIGPADSFSVAQFAHLANLKISEIAERSKLPIVVGGTGLYLSALAEPIETLGVLPDTTLREKLATKSLEELQKELERLDWERWVHMNNSDRKNPRRLIRAIEIASAGDRKPQVFESGYEILWIGLTAPLACIEERIEKKIQARWDRAVVEAHEGVPILGVPPLLLFKRGEITKDEAIRQWVLAEYQYAKRQLTWFKKQRDITWFDSSQSGFEAQIEAKVRQWYT